MAGRSSASPAPQPAPRRQEATQRPELRVVDVSPRSRRPLRGAPRLTRMTPLVLVIASLLAVVVGHAVLAAGQLRLTAEQARLVAMQAHHSQAVASVAQLEAPGRIMAIAQGHLHVVAPGQDVQLPYVPLNVPLPPPNVASGGTSGNGGSSAGTSAGQ